MILLFHRLRREEEGQTLVLAAIFGLVLALAVLGTVNAGRAIYDKMQLQTACDDGAYSAAAVEARVLNFTAYTNRAMVVHYASILSMSAYLAWLHFNWAMLKGALLISELIPLLGEITATIDEIGGYVMQALDLAVVLATPLVAAANVVLYAIQEGAWAAVYAKELAGLPAEAHSGDSGEHPYQQIWPALTQLANQTVFAQVRGHATLAGDAAEAAQILLNAKDARVQQARLHMIEIANSARTPWVAYGDRYADPSMSPGARHWKIPLDLCNAQIGSTARTELGTFAPSGGRDSGQVFSGERLQLDASCSILGLFSIDDYIQLFGVTVIDDLFSGPRSRVLNLNASGIAGKVVGYILSASGAFAAMEKLGGATLPSGLLDARLFFVSPYVYFHPNAKGGAAGGLDGELGNFAQPDVVLGLAREGRDFNREPGAEDLYGGKFSVDSGAGQGAVDFRYQKKDWPGLDGLPLLHKGLNAFCAAQAYYHRPGDWREMPNLFNPLWGARLMPVMESNAAAALGLGRAPLLDRLLRH